MRNMVKFGFIAAVLSLISCSNLPDAPEFKFCKFKLNGEEKCESIHSFPNKDDCKELGGLTVDKCDENEEENEEVEN